MLAQAPADPVLMLTTFDEDDVVDAALRPGVIGLPAQELAARRPGRRHPARPRRAGALDPAVVPGVIARLRRGPAPPRRQPGSTCSPPRETDVLRLVGQGCSNAEIAAALFLGETTVKTHLGRVLDKLGLRDRPQAIAYAYAAACCARAIRPCDRSPHSAP